MSLIFYGLAAGAITGAILLFFSHLVPYFGAGNFIRDLDQPRILKRFISQRESHFIGIVIYLFFSCILGSLYAYLVQSGVYHGFDITSLLGWSVIMSLFFGGVILPLEGHGFFGSKEDAWFPIDLVLTTIIWVLVYWFVIRLWPIYL